MRRIEGLVRLSPIKSRKKRFLAYCDFGWHQGMMSDEKRKICERKKCMYYYKFEINDR